MSFMNNVLKRKKVMTKLNDITLCSNATNCMVKKTIIENLEYKVQYLEKAIDELVNYIQINSKKLNKLENNIRFIKNRVFNDK
jgi:hypothetical protein